MPSLSVTLPKGAWSKDEKAALIQETTTMIASTAVRLGKVPNAEAITPFISVQVNETAEGGYSIGGNIFG